MNSTTSYSGAEGPRKQPRWEVVVTCRAIWQRWFARSEGRVELQHILRALDRTAHSQCTDEPTEEKAVAAECRTISPNTCQAGLSRIRLDKDEEMERLDL